MDANNMTDKRVLHLPSGAKEVPDAVASTVTSLLMQGERVAAIKHLRTQLGIDLSEAAYTVDGWSSLWTTHRIVESEAEALSFIRHVFGNQHIDRGRFKITVEANQPLEEQ